MSDFESLSEDSVNNPDAMEESVGILDMLDEMGESAEIRDEMEERSNLLDELAVGSFHEETVSDFPEAIGFVDNIPLKEEIDETMDELVQKFDKMETLPDLVAELIFRKKLNTMILDLYDYDKGFEISFSKFGDAEEKSHGAYSYGVSIIDYIKDGEIPYELLDKLLSYDFQLYYDGYVACQVRIHFDQEDSMRSHYVLLKHSIQSIDGECSMNCEKNDSLDFQKERARLINHYSPDICLNPDPVVSDIIFSYELNQCPFITPSLRDVIHEEKARREMGVCKMSKTSAKYSESKPKRTQKDNDWKFRLKDPTPEEVKIAMLTADTERKPSIVTYLKERQLCFPDKNSFTGCQVEIENFVYEYDGFTRAKKVESIKDKLCIGVLDDKEYYYGAYQLDDRMPDYVSFYWWPIGGREALDLYVNAITQLEMRLSRRRIEITHNRMFQEEVDFSDGEMRIVHQKLENPASRVILQISRPSSSV